MAAVSQKIPNLLGGVSQQPDPVKLPGQVREAVNVYLDPTFGCRKRPATEFVARLANNVPPDAKWFNIFRDNRERYAVALYYDAQGELVLRVWDMNDGAERTVNISDSAKAYFSRDPLDPQPRPLEDISQVTVADYTIIANKRRIVNMNPAPALETNESALVLIKQVAYNSTYSIDLDGSAGTVTQDVTRATKISVTPGTREPADGGTCTQSGAQEFQVNHPTDGSKTGLSFRLVVNCAAVGVNGAGGSMWYFSRYTTDVQLRNGGANWQVGDTVVVNFKGQDYTIRVDEVSKTTVYASDGTANYTTVANSDAGGLDMGGVTGGLQTQINAIANYSCEVVGNCLRITKTNGEPFTIAVRGGTADTAMIGYKRVATDVTALPSQCFNGYTVKINNTSESDADDYYVRFETDDGGDKGLGSWVETVKPGIPYNLNASSMPQALIREANGSFTLRSLEEGTAFGGWGSREVGDEETNPEPSFVGRGISNVFFHANRLGFLSEDAVIMSQPGDYFNFFSVSALTVSDADPIDLTASSTKPAILRSVVGAPKGLILFAERSQFLLSTNEIAFAASTVKLTEISNYFYRSPVPPLSTGISVAFVSQANTYSKVMEMAVDSVENRPAVADITRIIPEYLPSDLEWGEVMPNNNMILYGDGSSNVYVFKFFNNGEERQLAGWARWVFPLNVCLWGAEDDLSYIVQYDGTNHTLVRMELIDDPDNAPLELSFSKFTPRLDNYVYKSDLAITSENELFNRITIPEELRVAGAQYVLVVTEGGFRSTFIRPQVEIDSGTGAWYVLAEKTLSSANFVLGLEYEALVTLPSFFISQEGRSDRVNIPVVENLYLDLYYSGSYLVQIDKLGYAPVVKYLEVTPANVYDADEPPINEISTLAVPIFSRGDIVKTTIRAVDPYPCSITGYSWEGHYNNRGISPIR